MSTVLIPFQIETQRVIQLLAKQIYQSPLALLRENTQNAFDAIRQRLHSGAKFEPRIDVHLSPQLISITDNGIGMTPSDLQEHYWKAGSSSKNNAEARAAGVVGTFGIGAMANFGIADLLSVETESALTGERTICRAERTKLSLTDKCIEREALPPKGVAGTTIKAHVRPDSLINVAQAKQYIAEFVSLVAVPVNVNGELVSQKRPDQQVAVVPEAWRHTQQAAKLGQQLASDVTLVLSNNADVWLKLTNLVWSGVPLIGYLVLRSGSPALKTFRSGFGLATASAASIYQFGGVADLQNLEPTAGREAITAAGLQLLQSMMAEIDSFTSLLLATRNEADSSTPFMQWVHAHRRYDLCGRLMIGISPGDRISLNEVAERTRTKPLMLYEGSDAGVIQMHASEETPLIVLSRNNPRRTCEQHYLSQFAKTTPISDKPVISKRKSFEQMSNGERALAFRLESLLDSDYFVKAKVGFGEISHQLPVVAERVDSQVQVTLNPSAQAIRLILGIYETEYSAFGSMVKDFIRAVLFSRIAEYVPSSNKSGAEAFLKAIRKPRELFEIADDDLGNLPKIWEDYSQGLITMEQAVERSKSAVRASIQVVDASASASARDVVPDVVDNEKALENISGDSAVSLDPTPAITRLQTTTNAKLLIIDENEPPLRGYRCFLAITDRAREEMGEFFLQPHKTSIVWGGQKTLFIFLHHSGQFGLYYDLQTREPVDAPAGGGPFPTATIVLKDRLFIPIPDEIKASFVPTAGEKKRFEVRADILRTEFEPNGST